MNNTIKKQYIVLILVLLIHSSTFSKGKKSLNPVFNNDILSSISYEAGVGISSSFVGGKFIKDFKNKYDNESTNLKVNAKTSPLLFGTVGAYAIYKPFKDSFFSKFTLTLGIEYYKRGFTEKYVLDYNYSPKQIQDKTNYSEKYALNMIGIPINVRYGGKAYLELGIVINKLISANKIVRIKHDQSGAEALDGGYSIKDKDRFTLNDAGLKSSSINFRLGGGIALNSKYSLKTDFMIINNSFTTQSNFHNYMCRLQFNKKIHSNLN